MPTRIEFEQLTASDTDLRDGALGRLKRVGF
jgi:hypothetical protein